MNATILALDSPRIRRSAVTRAWDHLSVYLPVVLMMMLALASYWLLRATPEPPQPEPERAVTHEPDYYMRRFSVKIFSPNGTLNSEMHGTEATHFPDTETVVIDNARVRSFNANRQLSTATAKQVTANGAGTEFELKGDAVVVRQAGRSPTGKRLSRLEFHGEQLSVSTQPEVVTSDRPVLLVRDADQITGDALDFRGDTTQVVEVTGNVRATLVSNTR
ncbi:MAG: LPS export ABC transporter periplasmic protein LptC [Hydrogenophaga sp.]